MIRLAALALLALCGCGEDLGDRSICGWQLTKRPVVPPTNQAGYEQAARACVEQWSARLSRGPDPARDIAVAVLATCHQELERAEFGEIRSYDSINALPDETTAYWRGQSLFIAMQSRAGDCYRGV